MANSSAKYNSVQYFVTITLKPHMYQMTAKEQFDVTSRQVVEVIEQASNLGITGIVVAELTRDYNVHYHAILRFYSKYKHPDMKFRDEFRRLKCFGRFYIEQVTNYEKCYNYILKSVERTSEVLECHPCIHDTLYKQQQKNIFDFAEQVQDTDTDPPSTYPVSITGESKRGQSHPLTSDNEACESAKWGPKAHARERSDTRDCNI